MKGLISILRASAIAMAAGAMLATPVSAAPYRVGPDIVSSAGPVQLVAARPPFRRGIYERGGRYYYGSYRVYRYPHRGYHYYDGWWIPPALFFGGLILGGVIANAPRNMSQAHIRWCYRHYRSYRESDNTFQPYHGPRRQCVSPYY